jgi:hypothetical protein
LLGRGVISRVLFPFGILFIYKTGENEIRVERLPQPFQWKRSAIVWRTKKEKRERSFITNCVCSPSRPDARRQLRVVVWVRLQQKRIVCLRLEKKREKTNVHHHKKRTQ